MSDSYYSSFMIAHVVSQSTAEVNEIIGELITDTQYYNETGVTRYYIQIKSIRIDTITYNNVKISAYMYVYDNIRYYKGHIIRIIPNELLYQYKNSILPQYIWNIQAADIEYGAYAFTIFSWRARLLNVIDAQYQKLSLNAYALSQALLFGKREYLSSYVMEKISTNGIMHLFALSGMHVAGILYVWYWFMRLFCRHTIVYSSLIVLLLFYWFLVGPIASLTRAIFMALVYSIFQLWHYRISLMRTIIFCMCMQLLFIPEFIYNIGFWVSYIATLGIALFSHRIYILFKSMAIEHTIAQVMSISFSAHFSAIVALRYFGIIPHFFASLLYTPIFTIFIIIFMICSILYVPMSIYVSEFAVMLLNSYTTFLLVLL